MDHIGASLKHAMEPSKETERGELMQYFRQRLNAERIPDGYPPLSMARMGKLLEKIPTKDLYYLKRICDDAPNFSKKFWWELNPKNFDETTGAPKQKDKKQIKKPARLNGASRSGGKPERLKGGGIRPQDYEW